MKRPFRTGFLGGFILGIMVCLSMDIILGGSLGGGWSEAVSNDIYKLFGVRYQTKDPVVLLGVVGVITFVGFIGGLMGGFFVSVVAKFYALAQAKSLQQEIDKVEIKNQDPSE